MSDRPSLRPSAKVYLHPGMTPERSPFGDITTWSGDEFRDFMRRLPGCDYLEAWDPTGLRQWQLRGIFTAKGGHDNAVYTRLYIRDERGDELAHADLTEASLIKMAEHMLEFAIAGSNLNGTPEVIAGRLMECLSRFLHPDKFEAFKDAMLLACEEEIRARVKVHEIAATQD